MSNPITDLRVLPELKLPRKIEADLVKHDAIKLVLKSQLKPLWESSPYQIAEAPWGAQVEQALSYAYGSQKLEMGIELIEKVLDQQKKGLDALHQKEGTQPAFRVSRILVVSNDGSERLFRACESLLTKHGDRLLMIRFGVPAGQMGQKIFGPDRGVKVLMVSDREAVENVLRALI